MRAVRGFLCAASSGLACGCLSNPLPTGAGDAGPDGTVAPADDVTVAPPTPTTDGAAPDAGCSAPQVPLAGVVFGPVLDDMAMPQSANGGSWYTYSSRSVPNSEPPVLTTDAGTLTPLEGTSFPPNNGAGCVPPILVDGGAFGYREFSGDGIRAWGAGFGLDLQSTTPDGGPVVLNACDAGAIFDTSPDASGVGIPLAFDASMYAGFAFWGISLTGGDLSIEVHLDDSDTTPWGGTFCDPCRSSGVCTGSKAGGNLDCPCSDNFYETVTFVHGQWTQFAVHWSDPSLSANHWSHEGPLVFDPAHVYNIHFQNTISSSVTPRFDIAVGYLQWLTH